MRHTQVSRMLSTRHVTGGMRQKASRTYLPILSHIPTYALASLVAHTNLCSRTYLPHTYLWSRVSFYPTCIQLSIPLSVLAICLSSVLATSVNKRILAISVSKRILATCICICVCTNESGQTNGGTRVLARTEA